MNKPIPPETLFFTVEQVAARYSVSTESIWRWTRLDRFPRPVKLGSGTTRWRLSDLLDHDEKLRCNLVMAVSGDLDVFFAQLAA